MAKGRPPKTDDDRLQEAARVLEVATLLKQGRLSKLKEMGFHTEMQATRFVSKRRRGLTGELVGKDATPAAPSYTRGAIRLVVEHDVPVQVAARLMYPPKDGNGRPMLNVKIGLTPDGKIPPALVRRALRKDRGRNTMDWRSVAKLVPEAEGEFKGEQARRDKFAKYRTAVVDITDVAEVETAWQRVVQCLGDKRAPLKDSNFSPKNPTADEVE